jgi:long-chain acyl-CoA synthetase
MSQYSWMTYAEAQRDTELIGAGLVHIGLAATDKLTLFASTGLVISNTRRDWMLVTHGCFSQNITITTAYDTLGEDGLAFSLNEGTVATYLQLTKSFHSN